MKEAIELLETNIKTGLSEEEAEKRIKQYGYNEIKSQKKISPWKIFIAQFKSLLILILVIAVIISAFMGEWIDATVIFVILILNAIMGFIQEYKAEKSIEALKRMAGLKAVVLREGVKKKIDVKNIVPGDILILETGEKIPADARIIESINLKTQEGALTGESTSVEKTADKLRAGLIIGDQKNMVFSGTIVTNGRGKAVVTATGMKTQIGRIAGLIQEEEREPTHLQKKLSQLSKWLGIVTIIISIIVFLTGVLKGGLPTEMFLAAVSLAVAAIPEGLPAVITIALGIGVQKMVRKNALVRKLPSVETLGAVTVICSDKTGTLTHNQMTVTNIFTNLKDTIVTGSGYEPEGSIKGNIEKLILRIGVLCNDAQLSPGKKEWGVIGDPTEGCLLTVARKAGINENNIRSKYPRIGEIGFDSDRKMMTSFHKINNKIFSYTKGAPDIILKHCDRILINGRVRRIKKSDIKIIEEQISKYSSKALRVLGFAYKSFNEIPKKKINAEEKMIFVGLQAMMDPPREEVKEAIKKCHEAGIKVVMITGDHLDTARAIAKELNIEGKAIKGEEIKNINLEKEVNNIGVFARVNPQHKLLIVEALKKKGHIVAMTGDGVNDAPALKKADIGIAMGITGTDVAKEASDMILTDDNFASIVSAVEEGRNIYNNIKKFVNYLLSSNMGEVMILFFAMLIGFKYNGSVVLPLLAIHILWVNLVTDGLPALALGVDPADKNIMKRKPRRTNENIVSKNMTLNILSIGILLTIAVLFTFNNYLKEGLELAQTMALTLLVILEIVRLEMIRSQYNTGFFSNKYLTWALIIVLGLQIIVIYTPLNKILHLTPLSITHWLWIIMISASIMIIGEVLSIIIRRISKQED